MAIFSGILIMKIGYFTPLLFLGSGVFTIGGTLTYTLKINSSLGEYLAYQAVLGLGQGLCIQLPVIVCQALSIPEDIPATTAMVLCMSFSSLLIVSSSYLLPENLTDELGQFFRCWGARCLYLSEKAFSAIP